MQLKHGSTTLKLLSYRFPKRGSQAEGYHLFVGGIKLEAAKNECATTDGGPFGGYTYLMVDGESRWVNGKLESGTKCEVIKEAPKAAATSAPTTAPVTPPAPPAPPAPQLTKPAPAKRPAAGKGKGKGAK